MNINDIENITRQLSAIAVKVDAITSLFLFPNRVNGLIVCQAEFTNDPCRIVGFDGAADVIQHYCVCDAAVASAIKRAVKYIDGQL